MSRRVLFYLVVVHGKPGAQAVLENFLKRRRKKKMTPVVISLLMLYMSGDIVV